MKFCIAFISFALCHSLAFAGGDYWWQNQQGVFGDPDVQPSSYPDPTTPYPAPAGNQFQISSPQNSNQAQFDQQPQNQVFQQQQQQPQIQQVACPVIGTLPPVEECKDKASNCWSVGQPDTDCPNDGLCCFDGCANTCLNGPPQPLAQQQSQSQPSNQNLAQQQPQPTQPSRPKPKPQTPKPWPKPQKANPWPKPQQQQRPRPQQQKRPKPQQQQRPRPQQQQRPRPQQQQRPQPIPQRQGPQVQADKKPYVACPSAMLCVPRVNCDFNGVITEQTLNLTPDLEMLRVPLIPCVSPQNQNVDVCCRDPNYKDPWPNMMMKQKNW